MKFLNTFGFPTLSNLRVGVEMEKIIMEIETIKHFQVEFVEIIFLICIYYIRYVHTS